MEDQKMLGRSVWKKDNIEKPMKTLSKNEVKR